MWATGVKASGGGFSSYLNTTFPGAGTMVTGEYTKCPFEVIKYDNDDEVDIVTNGRWDVAADGFYHLTAQATLKNMGNGDTIGAILKIYKNNVPLCQSPNGKAVSSSPNWTKCQVNHSVQLSAGDYIECFFWHNHGGNLILEGQENSFAAERFA